MRRLLALLIFIFFSTHVANAQTLPFAEREIDIENPYIGQPIIYILRIYVNEIPDDSVVIEPSFLGFGRSTILLDPSIYTEVIDTITYNVIEQRYVIYPLRAGELIIDPFRIEIPETTSSPAQTILTDTIAVNVQAYPEPIPDNFINAVGQFDISASAEPRTLNSGDALTLSLVISGTGNLEQILAPELDLPDNWDIFDAETTHEQDNLRFGSKTFEWTIIVEGDGTTTLPAIEFSYFNPQSGEYNTRTSNAINLNISPSTSQPEVTVERTLIVLTEIPIPSLLPIREDSPLAPEPPLWFWIMWIIPPFLTFFIWLFARPKRTRQESRIIASKPQKKSGGRALKELRQRLLKAQQLAPADAYQAITDAIYAYLSTKTGTVITEDDAPLVVKKFPANFRDELLSCLEEASAGQYAPISVKDVQVLSQRVLRVCVAIEKAS
ncbi:MAG: hypothetical protein Phog2KO_01720 [Phototrophicaceae bacterium]